MSSKKSKDIKSPPTEIVDDIKEEEDLNSTEFLKVTLKTHFGLDGFRAKQKKIIKTILRGRDVCAVMFTGAGKSLCYQFPSVHTNKTTVIISPLISLMNDQMAKLVNLGIKATALNSTTKKRDYVQTQILENAYRLVYTTPEFLTLKREYFHELYETGNLLMVAIDESHCVSAWGHDFRESYMGLSFIKETYPDLPVMALTATATDKTKADIIYSLRLNDPLCISTTFDRPNLYVSVIPKSSNKVQVGDILEVMDDPINDPFNDSSDAPELLPRSRPRDCPTIIYCQKRADTDTISDLLKAEGVKCDAYHAGMGPKDREFVQNLFINDEITCIVATIAFGMGIDKTIRKVIHFGAPTCLEDYYQEIGRAGRDGKKAKCYLLYSINDFDVSVYITKQIEDEDYRRYKLSLMKEMKKYLHTNDCRRKVVLEYFGEDCAIENCANCDNCIEGAKQKFNFTPYVYLLLRTIKDLKYSYGPNVIVKILLGSNAKNIKPEFKGVATYGLGKNHSDRWWKILLKMIDSLGYVEDNVCSSKYVGSTISLTKMGKIWLSENADPSQQASIMLPIPKDMLQLKN